MQNLPQRPARTRNTMEDVRCRDRGNERGNLRPKRFFLHQVREIETHRAVIAGVALRTTGRSKANRRYPANHAVRIVQKRAVNAAPLTL